MDEHEINLRVKKYYDHSSKNNQIITLFMLTYKRPDFVRIAIESVLKQTYRNFTLVLLDNLSGDNTRQVVESINDDRVVYIERDGYGEVSNPDFAFKIVQTKYVAIFHDDDVLEPEFLKNSILLLENNKEYSLVLSNAKYINEYGEVIKVTGESGKIITFRNDEYLKKRLWFNIEYPMIFPSAIYRLSFFGRDRSWFVRKSVGPAVDQFIYFQVERNGGVIAINTDYNFLYRIHSNQASQQFAGKMDALLMNALLNDDYYRSHVYNEKNCLSLWIKIILKNTINSAASGYLKKDEICKINDIIDDKWLVTWKSKYYKSLFNVFCHFPGFVCKAYIIMKENLRA